MNSQDLLTADVLDIIFEERNKAYGAYQLRKTYHTRLMQSMAGTLLVSGLFIAGWLLANGESGRVLPRLSGPDIILAKAEPPEKKIEVPVKPPPKAPEIAMRRNTTIRLVNEPVPEALRPPEQKELDGVQIGLETHTGERDGDITPPPGDGNRGILSAPEKKEADPPAFIGVEIEAEYPGGINAWIKFLQKNLENNYPRDAVENGIQGAVMIQFIVDREGNVSDVTAISGPEALRQAAITVIKRSGKWIPGIQNGQKVKSYKRQPIVFRLADE